MDGVQGLGEKIGQIISAVIGLAILAVVLSRGAQTVAVLQAAFGGFNSLLQTVMSPVSSGANAGGMQTGLASIVSPSTLSTGSTLAGTGNLLGGAGQLLGGLGSLIGGGKPAALTGADPFLSGGALKSATDTLSGWLDTTGQ